jgi:hypothetical protein
MKLIFLIVGAALGFGTGVWWGVHHPTQAAQLSTEEERRFVELQIKTTEAIKHKLDQVANRQSGSSSTPGSGFLGSSPRPSAPDPEINSLRDQQDQQLQQLRQRLQQLQK